MIEKKVYKIIGNKGFVSSIKESIGDAQEFLCYFESTYPDEKYELRTYLMTLISEDEMEEQKKEIIEKPKRYFSLKKYKDWCKSKGFEKYCNSHWARECDGKEVIDCKIKIVGDYYVYDSIQAWEVLK